ncbi:hypothetical protein OKW22_000540 [Bacilli bacterium PM5-3]|nr:hypothetical protein [Bacilli bacterium PM5-3]
MKEKIKVTLKMFVVGLILTVQINATQLNIDNNDKQSVKDAYNNWFLKAKNTKVIWDGNVEGCIAGKINDEAQAATFDMVNYLREMVGVAPVVENKAYSLQAQDAALASLANNSITHEIPDSWKCRTSAAVEAAKTSNLSWGSNSGIGTGADAVLSQMYDSIGDSNRAKVGHRQWIISPKTSTMGSGSTSRTNALKVIDVERNNIEPAGYISWPSAGYFPSEFTVDDWKNSLTWSISSTVANFNSASVSVKKNNQIVPTYVVGTTEYSKTSSGYGYMNTLVWEFDNFTKPANKDIDIYKVTISGITGGDSSTYEYEVKVFSVVNDDLDTTITNSIKPQISGTGKVGNTLNVSKGSWVNNNNTLTELTYSYEWYADNYKINNASTSSLTLTSDLVNKTISAKVFVEKTGYTGASQLTSNSIIVSKGDFINNNKPQIIGTGKIDSELTLTNGDWSISGLTYNYEWYANDEKLSEGSNKLIVTSDLTEKEISGKVIASKIGYNSLSQESSNTIKVFINEPKLINIELPTITGVAKAGNTISVSNGVWNETDGLEYKYQWYSNGNKIDGANKSTFYLNNNYERKSISAKVTVSKLGYKDVEVSSNIYEIAALELIGAKTKPVISGSAKAGVTLKVSNGTWDVSGLKYQYQWYSNGQIIKNATKNSLYITNAYATKKIQVKVFAFKDGYLATSQLSSNYKKIAKLLKFKKVNSPKISGTLKVGKTIKAKPYSSPKATSYKCVWYANNKVIKGATKCSYKIEKKYKGKKIKVKVYYNKIGYVTIAKTSAKSKAVK